MALVRLRNTTFYENFSSADKKKFFHDELNTERNFFKKRVHSSGFFLNEMNYFKRAYEQLNPQEKILGFNSYFCRAKVNFGGELGWHSGIILIGFVKKSRARAHEVRSFNGGSGVGILKCFPSDVPSATLRIPPDSEKIDLVEFESHIIETPTQLFFNIYEGKAAKDTRLPIKQLEDVDSSKEEFLQTLKMLGSKSIANSTETKVLERVEDYQNQKKTEIVDRLRETFPMFKEGDAKGGISKYFEHEKIPSINAIERFLDENSLANPTPISNEKFTYIITGNGLTS